MDGHYTVDYSGFDLKGKLIKLIFRLAYNFKHPWSGPYQTSEYRRPVIMEAYRLIIICLQSLYSIKGSSFLHQHANLIIFS